MATPEAFNNVGHDAWHSMRNGRTLPFGGVAKKIIGYRAPDATYATRLAIVGSSGIKARRIYGDFVPGGQDQQADITAAISAGMMPVISYKMGSTSITSAGSGGANSDATDTANYLQSLGVPIAASIWHEPEDNMTGAQYKAIANQITPILSAKSNLTTGPILHGFELDTTGGTTTFDSFVDKGLMASGYDYLCIDTYQSGTITSPGSIVPGDRIALLQAYLFTIGFANFPICVGEYNAYTAAAITDAGEKFLSAPNLVWACLFDGQSGSKSDPLAGDRLTAFQATKADGRVLQ